MKLLKIVTVIAFVLVALTGLAIGCGWSRTDHSIRFNGFRTWREMGRLPFLIGKSPSEASQNRHLEEDLESEDENPAPKDHRTEEMDELWIHGNALRLGKDFVALQPVLKQYLEKTAWDKRFDYEEPKNRQDRRNTAMDELDALTSLSQGSSIASVSSYMEARDVFDAGLPVEEMERSLALIGEDRICKTMRVFYALPAPINPDASIRPKLPSMFW